MVLRRIIERKMLGKIKTKPWKKRKIKRTSDALTRGIQHYCDNTSLHGLKYLVDPHLHWIERLIWFALIFTSSFTASNIIYTLACRFQAAPTSIGIASTTYKISALPFPSVTVCPNDRVDWNKLLDLEKRIFPNSTAPSTIKTFRDTLVKLSMMSFGDFDELTFLKERNLNDLLELNVTEVLRELVPNCEKLFSDCWWRNSNRNCCEIFEVQRTEYGFCYSFNSELAEPTSPSSREENHEQEQEKLAKKEERPRKASGYGDWSGVKVTIHLGNVTMPPDSEEIRGVVLMVSEPRVWPNSGTMTPEGSMVSVALDCVSGFATEPVLQLDEKRAPCRHEPATSYNQETCLSQCKRAYVIKYCNCNPSFMFPSNSHRDCNVRDFLCLSDHNDLFNDYYVLDTYGGIDPHTMVCGCPPECEYYIYNPQFATVPLKDSSDIILDVHFAGQTSFRYKTDIVITDLDVIVSFGGIIGLFLGGSLLSAAELIYYLMLALFSYLRSCARFYRQPTKKDPAPSVRTLLNAASLSSLAPTTPPNFLLRAGYPPGLIKPLPLLDYTPVKLTTTRTPLFLSSISVKPHFN